MSSSILDARRGYRERDMSFQRYLAEGKANALALLNAAVKSLNEQLEEDPSETVLPVAEELAETRVSLRQVFLVHGHDQGLKEEVARFLQKAHLDVVILHERPNKGRALINKFRDEARASRFAVVLISPDDAGGPASGQQNPRARQNVVFELGFFIGALGPENVAAIVKGSVEIPTDYEGVAFIPYERWKIDLAKELDEAGLKFDWREAMS